MKIQCDVCEINAATVVCCADEAALCGQCDVEVHAANKLASKHPRLQLHSPPTQLPCCDICQEKAAFVFCVEDRALFCQDCDELIHAGSTLAANHLRYLSTGIRVALGTGSLSNCRKDSETEPSNQDPPQLEVVVEGKPITRFPQTQQAPNPNHNVSPPASWAVDDWLEFPDFHSPNHKKGEVELGEFEWGFEMNWFEEPMGQEAAQVPQLPMSMGIPSCSPNSNGFQYRPPHKKPRMNVSYQEEEDEYSIVPDLG